MAGDWIKVEKATAGKPEVLRLSVMLNVHPMHALGLCVQFWSWCDDQIAEGHAMGVTKDVLDLHIGHAGLCDALESVGWLRVRNGSLEVPHFDRNLSESAKKRALAKDRKGKQRKQSSKPVPQESRTERDRSVTREEKRISLSHSLSPEMERVWNRWHDHRSQKMKPLSEIEADSQLMQLDRESRDEADAVAMVEFSISRGAVNLITNGDHRQQDRASKPARRPGGVATSFEAGLL